MTATRRASGAAFKLRPGESITFTLPVTPRTKKNSRVHAKVRGRTVPLPSAAYRGMEASIKEWARSPAGEIYRGSEWYGPYLRLAQPLNCAAIFYREKNIGDANGYYQGLADALEAAGIVANDKWIVQWDGSRLRKDAKRSRIEVTLTAIVGE